MAVSPNTGDASVAKTHNIALQTIFFGTRLPFEEISLDCKDRTFRQPFMASRRGFLGRNFRLNFPPYT
jgi:hypothetical protein